VRPDATVGQRFSGLVSLTQSAERFLFLTNSGGFPNKLAESGSGDFLAAPWDSAGSRLILKPAQEQFQAAFRIHLLQMFN
jgi:hypothetical protein